MTNKYGTWLTNQNSSYDTTDTHNQSGTKPNLVAKILATKFGVFFVKYTV